MCTLCSQIAPIASECVLGSAERPVPLTDIVGDARGASDGGSDGGSASAGAPGDGSISEMAEYLTDGYWESVNFRRFAFADGDISVNLTGLTGDGRQLARWALDAWEMVADLNFTETRNSAEITFQDHLSGAFAGPDAVRSNGVNSRSTVNVDAEWLDIYGTGIDSYSFSTYIHEIGHALGLGHMGPYDGSGSYRRDSLFTNDSTQMSVMSYFDQTDNTATNASYGAIVTPMMVDIAAIQDLYGRPGGGGPTSGNTIWGANTNLDNYMGTLFEVMAGGRAPSGFLTEGDDMAFTIYDRSGTDRVDLRFSDADNRVSLIAGTFSDIDGRIGNVGIALGTVIENVRTGGGDDAVTGNAANNEITTGAGRDWIRGGDGEDVMHGGSSNDTLHGDDGDDYVGGNRNNDLLYGDVGQDTLIGGGGNDATYGGSGDDRLLGGNGDDYVIGNRDNDLLYGDAGRDTLDGGGGDDVMHGGSSNDTLRGGSGDDYVGGNRNNDLLYGDAGQDTLIGGGGNDATYGGSGDDRLLGGNGDDYVIGNRDNDELYGQAGRDTLDGGDGDDVMYGGSSNDTLRGGSGDDYVGGNRNNDELFGEAGQDTLNGGGGDDVMHGSAGADVFVFGAGSDIVLDFDDAEGDRLHIDDGLLAGGVDTGQEVVDDYGRVDGGNAILDFGAHEIALRGVTDLNALADAIDII